MPENSFFHEFLGGSFFKKKLEKLLRFYCGAMDWAREARGPRPLGQGARAQGPSAPPGPSPSWDFIYFHVFVFVFLIFRPFFFKTNMKMVDEDCWMLEFRAENDTK